MNTAEIVKRKKKVRSVREPDINTSSAEGTCPTLNSVLSNKLKIVLSAQCVHLIAQLQIYHTRLYLSHHLQTK